MGNRHAKHIAVVGGGVVGLCCARALREVGHAVTLFAPQGQEGSSSHGNAGMVVPSHVIPLAAPGMAAKGLRYMMRADSPFYLRPRLSLPLWRWARRFMRSSTAAHVNRSAPILLQLNSRSLSMYKEWSGGHDFSFRETGLLMICRTEKGLAGEWKAAKKALEMGLESHKLNEKELLEMEPSTGSGAAGAVWFPGDALLDPAALMNMLLEELRSDPEVEVREEVVLDLAPQDHGVKIAHQGGRDSYDEVVVAAGAWSAALLRPFGLRMLLQGGKGYSFDLPNTAPGIRIPAILAEDKVAVSPNGDTVRFAGTLEIAGTDTRISAARVGGIEAAMRRNYPAFADASADISKVWRGLRPCSPDGLPYIGRLQKHPRVIVATGHAMMGVSMAPFTGRIVADIASGRRPEIDLAPLQPERFG